MYAHPGKKLLFMGDEFAAPREWNHDAQLDWGLLERRLHAGVARLVRDGNRLYRNTPALYEFDCEARGFEWIDFADADNSVLAFSRHGRSDEPLLWCSMRPPSFATDTALVFREPGTYREALNTDSDLYGGSNVGNAGHH